MPRNAKKEDNAALATSDAHRTIADLERRLAELQEKLHESEETLEAIRSGTVDAIVVTGDHSQQIYTLTNADRPYRILIEHMKEGAVTLTRDGITIYCNASFATLVGDLPERIVGTPFAGFVPAKELALFNLIFDSSEGGSIELMLSASDGSEIPVRLSLSQISDNLEGRIVCAIVTDLREYQQLKALERGHSELGRLVEERTASLLRLVEQRRRDEETLRQAEKLQVIGQLTGGIAHDFNNLLQVVSSGVALLKAPTLTPERRARLLDGIEQAATNGSQLVSRLLSVGRRQALRPQSFDLNERLRGLTDLLRRTLGSQIEIKIDLAPDLWPVSADPSQFEVALLNLTVNARDAMPSGGTLSLRTHNEASGATEQVCLTVEDTGTGMSPAVRARIFEPFFTTKEIGKGTGLGLPQVHGFAKQSGGDVRVDSEPGRGTRVTLCLPRASADPDASSAAVSGTIISHGAESGEAIAGAAGKVILVVDDNQEAAAFAAAMLEGLGYTVRRAGNAAEALAQFDAGERVDAVFSDVVMPGEINGAELAHILCRRCPKVAVVMASGYSDKLDLLRELPVELLAKPYLLDHLAAALARALKRSEQLTRAPASGR
jgi:PAS domain S-box-containing protein